MAGDATDLCCKICRVDAVNKQRRTVDVSPIDETAPFLDVNLQADQESTNGLLLLPRVGSYVIVALTNFGHSAAVVLTDDIEEVVLDTDLVTLNGGKLGGLVKIEELVNRLNDIEQHVNNLKSVFTGWTPAPNDGGAALKSAISSWATQTIDTTQRSALEDEKILH